MLPYPADIADREMARLLEGFQGNNSARIPGIFVTEVLHLSDRNNKDPVFDGPKVKDICGLRDNGTFRLFCKE